MRIVAPGMLAGTRRRPCRPAAANRPSRRSPGSARGSSSAVLQREQRQANGASSTPVADDERPGSEPSRRVRGHRDAAGGDQHRARTPRRSTACRPVTITSTSRITMNATPRLAVRAAPTGRGAARGTRGARAAPTPRRAARTGSARRTVPARSCAACPRTRSAATRARACHSTLGSTIATATTRPDARPTAS